MAQSTNPKTYSMMTVILVLGCLIVIYYLMSNVWPNYTFAKNQHDQVVAQSGSLKKTLDSVQSFLDTYQQQNANVATVNLALPTNQPDMANFVASVSDLATGSGVTLTNLQVDDAEEGGVNAILSQSLTVSAAGPYLAFRDFMDALEKHLRIIDVDQITLTGGATTGGTPILQYQIKLHTYYQQ